MERAANKASVYIKLAVIVVLTFFICTVGVNSTGFYFYNKGNIENVDAFAKQKGQRKFILISVS